MNSKEKAGSRFSKQSAPAQMRDFFFAPRVSDCSSSSNRKGNIAAAQIHCRGVLCFHKQVLLQIGRAIRAVLLTFLARRV